MVLPIQQAEKVIELLYEANNHSTFDQISIGIPDEGVIPHLENGLNDLELTCYYPGGLKTGNHELFLLISSLQKFFQHSNYDSFSSLIRHPEMLNFVVRQNPQVSPLKLLKMMDEFQNTYLPSTFNDMVLKLLELENYRDLKIAATLPQTFRNSFSKESFIDAILSILSDLFSSRKLNFNLDNDRIFRDVATLFIEHLSNIGDSQFDDLKLTPSERLKILLEELRDQRFYPERQPHSLTLLGWLELLWEDAPTIIISGMNNGIVPNAIVGDPYLPESLRKILHMKDNGQRFARDAYILAAITQSRTLHGNETIIFAKTNDQGDPLKPSRLLFLCDDSTLPARAKRLFGEIRGSRPVPRTSIDFKLQPKSSGKNLLTLSVTSFKDYLSCPFRFFLKHIYRMEAQDDRKSELDALDFGVICHAALEEFGREESVRESTDTEIIASFLTSSAKKRVKNCFGKNLPVSVRIQLAAIQQRLEHAARCQAKLRDAGWKIMEVERKIELENAYGSTLSIRGKVDRIDIHQVSGKIRIIDYKTSDTAVSPQKMHFKKATVVCPQNKYAYFDLGKKSYRWTDLQLPLYALMLETEMGQSVECGYFNLPKAVLETGVQIWPDLNQYLVQGKRCVNGVIKAIENQVFWPATPRIDYDPFESILLNNPEDLVDPQFLVGGHNDAAFS